MSEETSHVGESRTGPETAFLNCFRMLESTEKVRAGDFVLDGDEAREPVSDALIGKQASASGLRVCRMVSGDGPTAPEADANAGFLDADRNDAEKLPLAESEAMAETFSSADEPPSVATPPSPYNHELFTLLSYHGLNLFDDDELHQVARAAARCYPEVWIEQMPAPTPEEPLPDPEPDGALKAIMAAADGLYRQPCFHVAGERFCQLSENQHADGDHAFVSLATLVSSVAELAGERATCYDDDGKTRITWEKLAKKRSRQLAESEQAWLVMKNLYERGQRLHASTKVELDEVTKQRDSLHADCEKYKAALDRAFATETTPPAESYRLLETGEIIQVGDQWMDSDSKWHSSHVGVGKSVGLRGYNRRPITGGAGLHEAATCDQRPSPQQVRDDVSGNRPINEDPTLTGCLLRLERLEECGLLLSEIPPAEARLVISALATVFSA